MTLRDRVTDALAKEQRVLVALQAPFLLFLRLYWGWAFMQSGLGKLRNIEGVARWFGEDLGIPMPLANAYMAAGTEVVGGLCLLLGLATSITMVPLVFTMVVALLTSDFAGLRSLWMSSSACEAHPECVPFEDTAASSYFVAAATVLLFGPGLFSVDGLVARFRKPAPAPAAAP